MDQELDQDMDMDSSEGQETVKWRGLLSQIKDLMQKVANATQQTAVAVQSQDPVPNPYVRELQEKQAQYLELRLLLNQ